MDMVTELLSKNVTEAEEIMAKVRVMVEQNDIPEAKRLLAAARLRGVTSKHLERWQRILEQPVGKSSGQATGRRLMETSAWLKQSSSEYQGQWVALLEGKLIGTHPSRVQLQQSLQQAGTLQGVTFIRL